MSGTFLLVVSPKENTFLKLTLRETVHHCIGLTGFLLTDRQTNTHTQTAMKI